MSSHKRKDLVYALSPASPGGSGCVESLASPCCPCGAGANMGEGGDSIGDSGGKGICGGGEDQGDNGDAGGEDIA
nr:hypothetical protein [Tanacetum cinerariifolium]GFC71953.1 hypothetical protein [Tanacetum cinerariifolium]